MISSPCVLLSQLSDLLLLRVEGKGVSSTKMFFRWTSRLTIPLCHFETSNFLSFLLPERNVLLRLVVVLELWCVPSLLPWAHISLPSSQSSTILTPLPICPDLLASDDPTHGTVRYQSEGASWDQGLVSFNGAGHAVLKADTTKHVQGGRNSVRLHSNYVFNGGLILMDSFHMPTGCGAWPAWWANVSCLAFRLCWRAGSSSETLTDRLSFPLLNGRRDQTGPTAERLSTFPSF